MTALIETETWEAEVYQLETTDPVSGGLAGNANIQPRQLANRTLYLKGEIDRIDGDISDLQGDISDLAGDISDVAGDVSTANGDISNLQTDISNIQNNLTMQGIEGELFFLTVAF